MTYDTSIFVAKFVEEARDRIKSLAAALLRLEQTPGAMDAIAEALREAHSIKGSALMLGFTDISQISHQLEELFVAAKTKPALLDGDAFDIVFSAVDQMSSRIEQPGARPDGRGRSRRHLRRAGRPAGPGRQKGSRCNLSGDAAESSTSPVAATKRAELRQSLRVPIEKLDRLAHLAPEMVVQSLKAFERHSELRRRRARAQPAPRPGPRSAADARVEPVDRGAELAEYADALDAITRRMREFLVNFSDDRVRLNLITEELRQNVIELTMLPVASVFDAFPRAVRDLARSFDKEIDLIIQGRETELDKKIIEQIAEPLVHLIRNAADHGDRGACRSRARGQAGGRPADSFSRTAGQSHPHRAERRWPRDRSAGAARRSPSSEGVAPQSEIDLWTVGAAAHLIFQPGFSTRSSATDVSGRGVGMDVVRSVVERLGGAVRVQSELGTGHDDYAQSSPLARSAARRAARSGRGAVRSADGGGPPDPAVASLRCRAAAAKARWRKSTAKPSRSLRSRRCCRSPAAPATARQTVLVAEASDGRFGIIVDAVHEEQELVFKELRDRCAIRRRSPAPHCSATATSCRFSMSTRCSISLRAPRQPMPRPRLERRAAPRVSPRARRGRFPGRGRAAEEHSPCRRL